jgi:hypothetical protein
MSDWKLEQQIKLRQCEYRLRNCDQLRVDTAKKIPAFAALHSSRPWDEVRPAASEIMICAQGCIEEYRSILDDASRVVIPPHETAALKRVESLLAHCGKALDIVKPIYDSISEIIAFEDDERLR